LQTTLLGLAIALILALVAALVAPLLIDWTNYRPVIEAEAARILGADVRVMGAIDARFLPSPRLTLHDVEIGTGPDKVRANSVGIEFALSPLMRGQWQASEMHLTGPRLHLGLDASGHLQVPKLALSFDPDALSIERLSIEDGTVTLSDAANGAKLVLDGFWFNGEAHSLLGPFNGEGAATVGGDLYPFRVSTGRAGANGALTVRINVDPVSQPVSIAAEGSVALEGGAPRFDGTLRLARLVAKPARGSAARAQPWHMTAKIKATAARALLHQVEFQYGGGGQTLVLAGTAEFRFGKEPRFEGLLSGRQIDLDRMLAARGGKPMPPAAAVSTLAELSKAAFVPAIPMRIGIGIDQITLGGKAVETVRGDISTDAGGWNLDSFEFHAPGFSKVRVSGHLTVGDAGVAFHGPAELESTNAKALAAWIEARAAPDKGAVQPLRLRGDITLSSEKIAIERMTADLAGKAVTGKLVYKFAAGRQPTRLDAELNAPEIDLDAALSFGKAVVAGSNLARPHDMTIAANFGRATIAGIEARNAIARVEVSGDGFKVDRLSVDDLGGGALSASGRIDTGGRAPRGKLALDFETRQTAAIADLVGKFFPQTARPVADVLDRFAHTKLHATLDIAGAKKTTIAQLALAGDVDAMHIDAHGSMKGEWSKPSAAEIQIDGNLAAPEGATLLELIGLDRYVTAGKGPGKFELQVAGPANRDLNISVRLSTGDLAAEGHGRGQVSLDRGAKISGTLRVSKADLQPLWSSSKAGKSEPLPLSLTSKIAVAGSRVSFDNIDAKIGGSNVGGHLAVDDTSGRRIDGELSADTIDVAALLAGVIGTPAPASNSGSTWTWSREPFASGVFANNLGGKIAFKAVRASFTPDLAAHDFHATLHLDNNKITLADLAGELAGGQLKGELTFGPSSEGLNAQGKLALVGAHAAALLPAAARPPVTGLLDLRIEIEGTGLSPVVLIGSLHGTGNVAINGAQFARLDPRAFDVVSRAVDQGLAVDATAKIGDLVTKALERGQLSVKHADSAIAVSAGQVRLNDAKAYSEHAELSLSGNLDLTNGTLDARLVLSGLSEAGGARPDIFIAVKGPLAAPTRTVDVSALTGWLTLRALESQSKQLRALESPSPRLQGPPAESAPVAQPSAQPKLKLQSWPQGDRRAAPTTRAKQAPPLPPPLDIKPLPTPLAQPEASAVGPQH